MNDEMIKLGVVGLDGHGPVFSKEVNSPDSVLGAKVTAAMPVPSVMVTEDVLAKNISETQDLGVKIVEKPEYLASTVDGILILHDDGSKHLELFKRFVPLGKPIFIDKPLETTPSKAREIAELAEANDCPVFTGSALRFCPEVNETLSAFGDGGVISAMTYSPFMLHAAMPGWIYYAIHSVEHLYALMGPGCKEVRCLPQADNDAVAVGTWEDGRMGIARAISQGPHEYGFTAWSKQQVKTTPVNIDTIYSGLLKSIVEFVKTKSSPVSMVESVEVISFLAAANESMGQDGKAVAINA